MRIKRSLSIALLAYASLCTPFMNESNAQSKYWHQRVSLFELLPVTPGDIVFLGNSITDGGEFAELFGMNNIKNRGISGDVVAGVSKRLRQVTGGKPAKIFLLIGINDISHNLSAEKISTDYKALIKKIRNESPDTKLYIQSIFPIDNDFQLYKKLTGKEEVVKTINKNLEKIASEEDAIFINLTPILADDKTGKLKQEYTNDGLHLTGQGYKAWVRAIEPFVKQ